MVSLSNHEGGHKDGATASFFDKLRMRSTLTAVSGQQPHPPRRDHAIKRVAGDAVFFER
jgi:hypothetical protein